MTAQLNQNSEKIIEDCITLPLNQKLKNSTTSEYLRGGVKLYAILQFIRIYLFINFIS
ncbi:hypothetical protein LEP1GSC059_3920 [Leptospira noguchii serovar Panama str. CZ214]|uniref:Uncharacterized protein n=1 Tax=Leptospira noguchii serovar Panama str. CZ214 TaxID=1001595 RepID=T0FVT2_9LEPT|nr:hypothetical protein LEP1GSC059_3920 [Leptospira noguchii serovar Panama str. CZ214]